MDQPVRFQRQIRQLPVFLTQPVKSLIWSLPQISLRGCRKTFQRLHFTPFHRSPRLNSVGVHSRELTRRKDGLRIRAREPGDSSEDTKIFESVSSSTPPQTSSDIFDSKTFSRLPSSVPWNGTSVGVTVVTYLGVIHGPLGVGGLSLVASLLQQPDLDPQTKAVSLVILQLLEVVGAVWLVQSTGKQDETIPCYISELNFSKVWRNRGWLPTSALCLTCLLFVVGATSQFGDCVPKDMEHSNPVVELVTASDISRTCFYTVSCLITPYLEEYMYRGFLLTSLATYFGWRGAILASSAVFVVAHFPVAAGGQVLGLFLIGYLLGLSYVYTGNLATSFVTHALYNATLLLALSSSSC